MKKLLIALFTSILIITLFKLPEYQQVRFTSYHPGDSTGSGKCTASLLCTDSFETNENGWYTYEGKVVVAAATYACTALKTGVCGNYNELPSGFKQYNLHDEFLIEVNDVQYEAIVLDICGGSYWPEEYQRYDIYVDGREHVVNTNGRVIQPFIFRGELLKIYIVCIFILLITLLSIIKLKENKNTL